jgi:hypothetical protein
MRIIDAYKQISLAGGSKVRFSILADLGVEVKIQLECQVFSFQLCNDK